VFNVLIFYNLNVCLLIELERKGMYWWHTHRHGSSAMWTWAQGAGFVNIEGKLTEELAQQGIDITNKLPFVVTDPHYVYTYGETNTYVVATFLGGYVLNAFASGLRQA
jgi:hypothetical protein